MRLSNLLPSTLLLILVLAAPARAGTYVHAGMDGWSPAVHAPRGFVAAGPGSGGIGVQFWGRTAFAPGDRGAWSYDAPADTTIVAWAFERAIGGIGGGHWNTLFGALTSGRRVNVAHDVPSVNRAWGRVAAGGLSAQRVDAVLQCGGPLACVPAGTAWMALRGSRVTLDDPFAPVVSLVQGDLVAAPVLRGTAALSFAAVDRGGGVHRAFAEIDGRAGTPVAVGDERCRALAAHEFAYRRPCPLSAGATVTVDTTRLAEGRHEIAVVAEDAAGNRTTVYGPIAKAVDNRPDSPGVRPPVRPRPSAPVAAPARVVTAWLERRRRRVLTATVPYGVRVRLRGRVTTGVGGRHVAGAAVAIAEQVVDGSGRRRAWRPVTGVRTRADGRFTAFTRVGPSRRIRVAGAPLVLTVNVRARVTAHVVRGAVLRGRVVGARRGALVELQARAGRRWVTRRVVRTFAGGRFSGRPAARGVVRARVPVQPGLPYAAGVSAPRRAGRTAPRTSR